MNVSFIINNKDCDKKIEIIKNIKTNVDEMIECLKKENTDLVIMKLQELTKIYPIKSSLKSVINVITYDILRNFELDSLDITFLIIRESFGDDFMSGYKKVNDTLVIYNNYWKI